jgi:hypothetical protein
MSMVSSVGCKTAMLGASGASVKSLGYSQRAVGLPVSAFGRVHPMTGAG